MNFLLSLLADLLLTGAAKSLSSVGATPWISLTTSAILVAGSSFLDNRSPRFCLKRWDAGKLEGSYDLCLFENIAWRLFYRVMSAVGPAMITGCAWVKPACISVHIHISIYMYMVIHICIHTYIFICIYKANPDSGAWWLGCSYMGWVGGGRKKLSWSALRCPWSPSAL